MCGMTKVILHNKLGYRRQYTNACLCFSYRTVIQALNQPNCITISLNDGFFPRHKYTHPGTQEIQTNTDILHPPIHLSYTKSNPLTMAYTPTSNPLPQRGTCTFSKCSDEMFSEYFLIARKLIQNVQWRAK